MLHPYVLAIVAAMAYGTNSVIAKHALDNMPVYIYVGLIAFMYICVTIGLLVFKGKEIYKFVGDKANHKHLAIGLAAVFVGTVFADTVVWNALKAASPQHIPIVSALINITPVFSLLIVMIAYGVKIDFTTGIGFVLLVLGSLTISYAQA
jgi:drug/metabolite transporter (DMT)-like permease